MALTSHSEVSFLVLIQIPGFPNPVSELIDSGATSNFLDSSLADSPLFVTEPLDCPIALCLFDGKPATAGFIHESVTTSVAFTDGSTQNLSSCNKTPPVGPDGVWPAMATKYQPLNWCYHH